jgi:hypothetical protein
VAKISRLLRDMREMTGTGLKRPELSTTLRPSRPMGENLRPAIARVSSPHACLSLLTCPPLLARPARDSQV